MPMSSGPHGRRHEVAEVLAGQLACSMIPAGQTEVPPAPPAEPSGSGPSPVGSTPHAVPAASRNDRGEREPARAAAHASPTLAQSRQQSTPPMVIPGLVTTAASRRLSDSVPHDHAAGRLAIGESHAARERRAGIGLGLAQPAAAVQVVAGLADPASRSPWSRRPRPPGRSAARPAGTQLSQSPVGECSATSAPSRQRCQCSAHRSAALQPVPAGVGAGVARLQVARRQPARADDARLIEGARAAGDARASGPRSRKPSRVPSEQPTKMGAPPTPGGSPASTAAAAPSCPAASPGSAMATASAASVAPAGVAEPAGQDPAPRERGGGDQPDGETHAPSLRPNAALFLS